MLQKQTCKCFIEIKVNAHIAGRSLCSQLIAHSSQLVAYLGRLLLNESINIFHPSFVFFQRTRNLPSSNSTPLSFIDCQSPSSLTNSSPSPKTAVVINFPFLNP